jgi:DNA repair protein RadA/Sms
MAVYRCLRCERETSERLSCCPGCHSFDTMIDERENAPDSEKRDVKRAIQASKLTPPRSLFMTSGFAAWDHVLGGGFVRPSSILVSGSPGVGKSTAALAIAYHVALQGFPVLYGSAEMPGGLVRLFLDRLSLGGSALSRLWVRDETEADGLLEDISSLRPALIVWDSIQRYRWEGEDGETALRQIVRHAIDAGRGIGAITLLISQATKEGDFLGPNGLAHDVDVMIELVKSENAAKTIVRCRDKNRFATTPREAVLL